MTLRTSTRGVPDLSRNSYVACARTCTVTSKQQGEQAAAAAEGSGVDGGNGGAPSVLAGGFSDTGAADAANDPSGASASAGASAHVSASDHMAGEPEDTAAAVQHFHTHSIPLDMEDIERDWDTPVTDAGIAAKASVIVRVGMLDLVQAPEASEYAR